MIVVTVGTQLPFDRLIRMIDQIAPQLSAEVFAQTGRSSYIPKNIAWSANVSAGDFDQKLQSAEVIVSHAGIGTVLKAYKFSKPIILVPRREGLGEHRNDHQLATVSKLRDRSGIYVAETSEELVRLLSRPMVAPSVQLDGNSGRARLKTFIASQVENALR